MPTVTAEATNQLHDFLENSTTVRTSDIIKYVRAGADPNILFEGTSVLHMLSSNTNNSDGRNNWAIKELVRFYAADIHIRNAKGYTPLERLIKGTFSTFAAMSLVHLWANPNSRDNAGETLLHILSSKQNNGDGGNDHAIKELVNDYHADINILNGKGYTPLESLMNQDSFSTEAAMKLVRLGADPLSNADNGRSLLEILSSPRNNANGKNDCAIQELKRYIANATKAKDKIYHFSDESIDLDKLTFKVTERAKNLFSQGVGGDYPVVRDPIQRLFGGGAQGYAGFLDLSTGEIELVPAWNKDDGKIRKKFYYKGKTYGVESKEPLGSNSGDVHTQGLVQLGLVHKGGINRQILGFGIFKGRNQPKKPFLLQFRCNSHTQNRNAICYDETFLMYHYKPGYRKIFYIQRTIPEDIAKRLLQALLAQLPRDDHTQYRSASALSSKQCTRQAKFIALSEGEIEKKLIKNILVAAEHDDIEAIERILKLRTRFCSLSLDYKNKRLESLPEIAYKKGYQKAALTLIKMGAACTGNHLLIRVIENKDIRFCHTLMASGIKIDINAVDARGRTPLMIAASTDIDLVRKLIKRGLHLNYVNQRNETALTYAATSQIALYLIKVGASPTLALLGNLINRPKLRRSVNRRRKLNAFSLINKICIENGADLAEILSSMSHQEKNALLRYAIFEVDDALLAIALIKAGIDIHARIDGCLNSLKAAQAIHENEIVQVLKEYQQLKYQNKGTYFVSEDIDPISITIKICDILSDLQYAKKNDQEKYAILNAISLDLVRALRVRPNNKSVNVMKATAEAGLALLRKNVGIQQFFTSACPYQSLKHLLSELSKNNHTHRERQKIIRPRS